MNAYADLIHPLVEKITRLCQENDLPMLMAFCLDQAEKGDGKMQMTLTGSSNLSEELAPPSPMLWAASMLQIPGFKIGYQGDEEVLE